MAVTDKLLLEST